MDCFYIGYLISPWQTETATTEWHFFSMQTQKTRWFVFPDNSFSFETWLLLLTWAFIRDNPKLSIRKLALHTLQNAWSSFSSLFIHRNFFCHFSAKIFCYYSSWLVNTNLHDWEIVNLPDRLFWAFRLTNVQGQKPETVHQVN